MWYHTGVVFCCKLLLSIQAFDDVACYFYLARPRHLIDGYTVFAKDPPTKHDSRNTATTTRLNHTRAAAYPERHKRLTKSYGYGLALPSALCTSKLRFQRAHLPKPGRYEEETVVEWHLFFASLSWLYYYLKSYA
jgi:hypothetical protein